MKQLNAFILDVAPALKTAFIHAGKVAGYIVLSAAIAAAYAYLAKEPISPVVFAAANVFLSAAQKAIATLNEP